MRGCGATCPIAAASSSPVPAGWADACRSTHGATGDRSPTSPGCTRSSTAPCLGFGSTGDGSTRSGAAWAARRRCSCSDSTPNCSRARLRSTRSRTSTVATTTSRSPPAVGAYRASPASRSEARHAPTRPATCCAARPTGSRRSPARAFPCRSGGASPTRSSSTKPTNRRTSIPSSASSALAAGSRPSPASGAIRPRCATTPSCPRPSDGSGCCPTCSRSEAELFSDDARTGNHRLELVERALAGEVLHPAVRRENEPLRRHHRESSANPVCDDFGRLDRARAEIEDPKDDRLVGEIAQQLGVEVWLCRLEREVRRKAVAELAQKRVAGESFVNDVRVAEARVEDGVPVDAVKRAIDRTDGVLPRGLRARLEIRLVDLDDVGSGCFEVPQLLVHGMRVREREAPLVGVVIVLSLLRHRERPRNGDLDPTVRDRAEKLDVAHLDRPRAADRPHDSRDGIFVTRAIERDAGLVEIDAVERGREPVRVALPPHLPVRDHVDACTLHVANGEPCRVVLRLLQERLRYSPERARSHARRQTLAEPLPVDQPVGLGIAPDDRREQNAAHECSTSFDLYSLRCRLPHGTSSTRVWTTSASRSLRRIASASASSPAAPCASSTLTASGGCCFTPCVCGLTTM